MVGDDFEPPSWLFGRDLSQTAWKGREHVWQAMISNTRVLSPTKLNEFRFGTDYFFNSTGRELAFKKNVIAEVGLPNFPSPDPVSWGIPSV
jgi:hypothetical protein